MKKTYLFLAALLATTSLMAQSTSLSAEQQRRRTTIADPRQAGTAVLLPSMQPTVRDYTKPAVLNTLNSASPSPAFILMRTGSLAGSLDGNYPVTAIPNLSVAIAPSSIATSNGQFPIPYAPVNGLLNGLPSIIRPIQPIITPIITPILPLVTPIIPGTRNPIIPTLPIVTPKIPGILPIRIGG